MGVLLGVFTSKSVIQLSCGLFDHLVVVTLHIISGWLDVPYAGGLGVLIAKIDILSALLSLRTAARDVRVRWNSCHLGALAQRRVVFVCSGDQLLRRNCWVVRQLDGTRLFDGARFNTLRSIT